MADFKLFDGELKFANIVWENEPLSSGELVILCRDLLGWKKSTVYTVLKKLCDRKILRNVDSVVSSIVKKKDVQEYESEVILERMFDGSLPKFIASFLGDRKLSDKELSEIKDILDLYSKDEA